VRLFVVIRFVIIYHSFSNEILNLYKREWLQNRANARGGNQDKKICVERTTTAHNLWFCVYTLRLHYVTEKVPQSEYN